MNNLIRFNNILNNRPIKDNIGSNKVLANPPFNASDWGQEKLLDDHRWKFGIPPKGNANYAWIEHMISKLAPSGTAGFVLANGSMSTSGKDELEIRKNLIEQDIVECIVTLPGQLFYSTPIPVCLWFISKDKEKNGKNERRGEVLFIDARNIGSMVSRTLKEFSDDEIKDIANIYHSWRGTNDNQYEDKAGFCRVVKTEEIKDNEYILTPGRYVGLAEVEEDSEPFEQKMERITADLSEQFAKSKELEDQIRKSLEGLGYGV